ncbi:MAG: sucrase ferredoxin [Sporichthyaceae bacterium]
MSTRAEDPNLAASSVPCRVASLNLDEPLLGTASLAMSWLLLEHPGPWGSKALSPDRFPPLLGQALKAESDRHGIRVNLIRRPVRDRALQRPHAYSGPSRAILVHTGPGQPWIEQVALDDIRDALSLDLAALARGERSGLDPHPDPLFAICAHTRKDPCCAVKGRPVAAALAARYPELTWETTHLGGDRFAGNLVCFPHGLYFGRLDAEAALSAAAAYCQGQVTSAHYRGRTCWPGPVQAAEMWLREQLGLHEIDAVTVLGGDLRIGRERVDFAVAHPDRAVAGTWAVRLRIDVDERLRSLSCGSEELETVPSYVLLGTARTAQPS